MLAFIFATLVAASSPSPSPSPSPNPFLAAEHARLAAVVSDTNARACQTQARDLRVPMYGLQLSDAFATAAAVRGGASSRTPFGSNRSAFGYVVSESAFDAIVGAFTRHDSCGARNTITGIIEGSALLNKLEDRK